MKLKLFLLVFLGFALSVSAAPKVKLSGKTEKISKVEIFKANSKPVIDYAAKELQKYLEQAMGCKVPVVQTPSSKCLTFVLGDSELTRKAGVDVDKLPAEGFYIKRHGGRVYIAGKDSDTKSPSQRGFNVFYQRGTLTGVYDFLERFADARFFFPGRYGTVVPAKGALYLPAAIEITDSPDMFFRRFSLFGGAGERYYGKYDVQRLRRALLPPLKSSELRVPFTHGLNGLDLINRFGKTHPEYFALMANGKRYNDPSLKLTGQLCYTSGVREVIIQDAIAYFSKLPPSSRGMKRWDRRAFSGDFMCIMPQDGMDWCRCENCKKIWNGKASDRDAQAKAISDFMFRFFKEVCDRLKEKGLKHRVTTMAYFPYNIPPAFPLPDELMLQVAVAGLSGGRNSAADTERLKNWYERTGRKVTAWTYSMGKHQNKVIPGVPAMMPRNAAAFLKTNGKYLDGVYFESETDRFLFNYLNYYVVLKLMWNNSLDVEDILADHFKVMFGKGAPFMAEFYAELENNWAKKILGGTGAKDFDKVSRIPSIREVWTRIYTPERLAHYNKLFDQAQQAVGNDKGAAERVKFIREEILKPIEEAAEKYNQLQKGMDLWVAEVPGTLWLRPFKGDTNAVNTRITLRKEKEQLIVRCECEEPRMKDLIAECTANDDIKVFTDSVVEILLNPSGDRKNYFQFGVNANGVFADARCVVGAKADFSWNSGAAARGGKGKDGWWAEIAIPLKSLGKMAPEGFPANFARHRALSRERVRRPYYMWRLFDGVKKGGFHKIDDWGKLTFKPVEKGLIPNGNFEKTHSKGKKVENWSFRSRPGALITLDDKCFISGGRSIRLESDGTENVNFGCRVPEIKAGKKYRLSFFLKTEKLTGKTGAGAWVTFCKGPGGGRALPKTRIVGDNSWHRLSFEFTAPPGTGRDGVVPSVMFWIWGAKGKAWFDEIRLEEVPGNKKMKK